MAKLTDSEGILVRRQMKKMMFSPSFWLPHHLLYRFRFGWNVPLGAKRPGYERNVLHAGLQVKCQRGETSWYFFRQCSVMSVFMLRLSVVVCNVYFLWSMKSVVILFYDTDCCQE